MTNNMGTQVVKFKMQQNGNFMSKDRLYHLEN